MDQSHDDVAEELRSQLEEWNMGLDELQSRVERAEAEHRSALEARIKMLRKDYEEARDRLQALAAQGGETWEEFREGMTRARRLLDEALEETQPDGDAGSDD
jgi:predicted nuclease with TOPRIM domain